MVVRCELCGKKIIVEHLAWSICDGGFRCDECIKRIGLMKEHNADKMKEHNVDKKIAELWSKECKKSIANNQEAKADAGKPKLSLVPTEIINCIAMVREFGNRKYKDANSWKRVEKQRYVDAMFRHLIKYVNDNNAVDEESGLPHLWHLATNVAFLCEMEKAKE